MGWHRASAKRTGITEQDFQGLKSPANAQFTPKERAALALAEKLTRTPTNNAHAELTAAKALFNDLEMIDVVATIALANMTNRMTDGFELELDAPKVEL